jgi:signal transduction histidine kinase/CheY-like chemotaxis protein/HAMP domain-containing protein
MKLSIATKLALSFLPALLALLTVGWFFYDRLDDIAEDRQWVIHTLEVLQEIDQVEGHLARTEGSVASQRLSGRDEFRHRAREAAAQATTSLQQLRMLTRDNPAQQARVGQAEVAVTTYLGELLGSMDVPRDNLLLDPDRHQEQPSRQALGAVADVERTLLRERREKQLVTLQRSNQGVLIGTGVACAIVCLIGLAVVRAITRPLLRLEAGAQRVGEGDYTHRVESHTHDEIGRVATVFNRMVEQIETREQATAQEAWVKSQLAGFNQLFQGGGTLTSITEATLSRLAEVLKAPFLVLYLRQDDAQGQPLLVRCAHFAAQSAPERITEGQGLAGQCLAEAKPLVVSELPEGYVKVSSALGSTPPRQLYVTPILFESRVRAVLEVALLQPLNEAQTDFLARFNVALGLVLDTLEARRATDAALKTQTELARTLEHQRQALQEGNEELALQSDQLRASERLAREQQEELRLANEEQHQANKELRELTQTLDLKARQLAETSAFKSEFLANMSHELRTPLNSLLILSKLLAEDGDTPLSPKQQQYARTIHESGTDLLQQINEILDLARIESGKVRIDVEPMDYAEVVRLAESGFRHVAQAKSLDFTIELDPQLSPGLNTDPGRLWQILKNLLSNAFKFTSQGGVTLHISRVPGLPPHESRVAMTVVDTGIGIPPEKQALIFEAFQQGDSGISRQYGGTGLGLSISLKLAKLLGGSVAVRSEPGKGSRFSLELPEGGPPNESTVAPRPPADAGDAAPATSPVSRPLTPPGLSVVPARAPTAPATATRPATAGAHSVDAERRALVVATRQQTLVSALASLAALRELSPVHVPHPDALLQQCVTHAPALVVLDLSDDDAPSWTAMSQLKQDARTRHIGVHALCHLEHKQRALRLGAASCSLLPLESVQALQDTINDRLDRLTQPQRNVLVVEDDATQRAAILDLIGNGDIKAKGVGTGAEALQAMSGDRVDCVVIDLGLPDMDGGALMQQLADKLGNLCPPIIIYTARHMEREEELSLMKNAQALIVKGASSPERLIDELTLLLSRWPSKISPATRALIDKSRQHDPVLAGRKVLVVDDDVRNIFAISAALEVYGAVVHHAEGGLEGIAALQAQPDTALVLMDVMMPNVDGLETTRRIRAIPEFEALPIIAVTAKAMPGDRDTCLEAGASDYLSKPVDMDHLRAMIRVWLAR